MNHRKPCEQPAAVVGQKTETRRSRPENYPNSSLAGRGFIYVHKTEIFRIRAKIGRTGHWPGHKIARNKNMANNMQKWDEQILVLVLLTKRTEYYVYVQFYGYWYR